MILLSCSCALEPWEERTMREPYCRGGCKGVEVVPSSQETERGSQSRASREVAKSSGRERTVSRVSEKLT